MANKAAAKAVKRNEAADEVNQTASPQQQEQDTGRAPAEEQSQAPAEQAPAEQEEEVSSETQDIPAMNPQSPPAPAPAPAPVSEQLVAEKPPEEVTMMFPRPVNVIHNGVMHKFGAGVQKVPKFLEGHWYLKANNVSGYTI